ncbi:Bro-N domain-containing protein [Escherichia coli]|uniref:BRO-N domain-containing protein n=1 Tax=Escherichia coli TaxID=562 RepID=UPI001BE22021|nr:Bro-N domain-containing protein [Escherichia coli]EIM2825863.1 Bro-N domain-containing protein [Escherichia coli]ELE8524618.1 Bro-N domain-containing protein [Escherichia coli]ELI0687245.1 Bro-N domain-containing protein [Escherichia coli]ELJ6825892.1 Bro-N domain-containing protein [Escherichia coli]EMA4620831.1 Bro-N domain-containing protein [Escherichia coli]
MSALAVFSFQEEHQVRVVMIDSDPWFVAADVCNAIGIINHRDAVGKLDEDEKGVGLTDTLGGKQGVTIINESGLYTLILRCRDAVKQGTTAWRFRKWVTNEVLPSIRKNGEYVYIEPEPMRAAEPLNWRQKAYLRGLINDIAQSFRCRNAWISGIWLALRRACRNPSPNPITVDDLPAIAAELRRILTAAESALRNMRTYERELLRDVVRGGRRSMSCGDLPIIDINSDLEKALPAHFELAVQKLEQLSAQLKPAEITNK